MKEIWNSGNFNNLTEHVSPQYKVINDPGDQWNGKILNHDEFKKRIMYSRNAFPDLFFDIQDVIEGDNKIATHWVMSGTHHGDLPLLPATGKKFNISGITFYYFIEGKISGHRQAFDRLGFLMQIQALVQVGNIDRH